LQPLSAPLQRGVRLLRDPLPAATSDSLTAAVVCHTGQTPHRAYPVPRSEHGSGGFHLSAGDRLVSAFPPSTGMTDRMPFWPEPGTTSHVWLSQA
jgi:hypothetical protein